MVLLLHLNPERNPKGDYECWPAGTEAAMPPSARRRATVLIVDDEDTTRNLCRE